VKSVLPGSEEERKYTRVLLRKLRDTVDWVKVVRFPVYAWSSECGVEINGVVYDCAALPYSPPVTLDTKPEIVRHAGSRASSELRDNVVLAKYPESYVELRWLYYILSKASTELVVFYTNRDFLKADTVLGTAGLTFNPSTLPRVPVICVTSKVAGLLVKRHATVRVSTRVSSGEALLILAGINGPGESVIHVVGYHDTILGDPSKTSSRVLPEIARYLKSRERRASIVLVSSSAREIGDWQFTEYHLAWGLRYLLELLDARGELSRVHGAVVLGPIHAAGSLRLVAHPALREVVLSETRELSANVTIDYNHALLESYLYATKGIPALTATTLPRTWWYYNSTLESQRGDEDNLVSRLTARLVNRLAESDYSLLLRELEDYVVKSLGEVGLEIRSVVFRARSLSRVLSARDYVREITKLGYTTFYTMCSDPLAINVQSDLLVDLSESAVNSLRRNLEECRGDLVIGNSDWYVVARAGSLLVEAFLRGYVERTVKNKNTLIDSSIVRFLCERALKVSSHGVEEHRNRQVRELQ